MKRLIAILIGTLLFSFPADLNISQSNANECSTYETLMSVALGKGDVSAAATYQQKYKACLSSGSGWAELGLTCSNASLKLADALSKGDVDKAAVYKSFIDNCRGSSSGGSSSGGSSSGGSSSGGSSSGGSSSGGSSSGGCNYNGVAYSSCADANAQYQRDLAAATKWTCGGQTFNTKAEADAYCATLKTCNSAPATPEVTVTFNEKGILLTVMPQATGEKASKIAWSTTKIRTLSTKWESWDSWREFPFTDSPILFQIDYDPQFRRVAFGVVSRNDCGDSPQFRESIDKTGIDFPNPILAKAAADKAAADKAAADKAAADKAAADKAAADKKSQYINLSHQVTDTSVSSKYITLSAKADSGLRVTTQPLDSSICSYENNRIVLFSPGTCEIYFEQAGNEFWKPAPISVVEFSVLPRTLNNPLAAKVTLAPRSWASWIETYQYISGANPLKSNQLTFIQVNGTCNSSAKSIQPVKNTDTKGKKYSNGSRPYGSPWKCEKSGAFKGVLAISGGTRFYINDLPKSRVGTQIEFRVGQEIPDIEYVDME